MAAVYFADDHMMRLLPAVANLFPLWVLLASISALVHPAWFTWFSGPWITWGLGVIMLGMGITLTTEDFTRVLQFPSWVMVGIILHYTVMPFSGWALAKALHLPDNYAVGLILVACCPCGTASNVVSYLARANVALSVTLTTLSTMIAVAMTPLLTAELAGCPADTIGAQTTLEDVGLDSSDAVILVMEVEEMAGREIDVGIFLRFATLGEAVDELARILNIEPG